MSYVYSSGERCYIGDVSDIKPSGLSNDKLIETDDKNNLKNVYINDGLAWVLQGSTENYEEQGIDIVARAMAVKHNSQLNEIVYNVKLFGVIGDGVFDNKIAITNLVNKVKNENKCALYFPKGTYYSSSILTFDGIKIFGDGHGHTYIKSDVLIGTNTIIENIKFGVDCKKNTFLNNSHNSLIINCYITGGNGEAIIYLNDSKVTDISFKNCIISGNVSGGNGVQIVDKGTNTLHYENIIFSGCTFENNSRMNFECIQRSNAGDTVTLGYRNISLFNCIFKKTINDNINVSYDSEKLADNVTYSSGYSTVEGNIIDGGTYGLELAGCVEMKIAENTIKNTIQEPLSISQITHEPSRHIITGNSFKGNKSVAIKGSYNIITSNNFDIGEDGLRFNPASYNIVSGNFVKSSGWAAISLEGAHDMTFVGNFIYGGTEKSVLNIYVESIHNMFASNYINNPATSFDCRNGTELLLSSNVYSSGGIIEIRNTFPTKQVLPSAEGARRKEVYFIEGGTGIADKVYVCKKQANDTYAWVEL